MAMHVRRREFIFTLGGAAATWPLAARAQQPAMPSDRICHRSRPGQSWSGRKHNRPGGNITGVVFPVVPLVAKLLGMLHELVPKASIIAVLHDPNGPDVESQSRELEEAARAIGRPILMVNAANEREFHAAFAKVAQAGAGGLLISSSVYFISQRRQLVTLAALHALPTVYNQREYAEVGGLISYGPSQTDAYRRGGVYVGRILKGEKPGDLPVELGTKYELVINLATAKAFRVEIPPSLLALADEVIE
jgi:putative tryptophan/tyrosine transport system substrate-binding protein